ncbi:MAG: PAS domain-containing protein [Pontiellaceae bacterium]|nr:PAS domain-containing protein [Pontiellaceae bacterium]MBN2783620.1 PAS domain-containing protein [Pontiellaceae bacterium]
MKRYAYKEAKETISSICKAAAAGEYDSRERFMDMLQKNSHIAVQGYNAFGKIFFWNDASALLYGHSESGAINQDLFELILPPDFRDLARSMVMSAARTGKMPEASACDLLQHDGKYISVFSGHIVFQWQEGSPEFYCIDLPLDEEAGGSANPA